MRGELGAMPWLRYASSQPIELRFIRTYGINENLMNKFIVGLIIATLVFSAHAQRVTSLKPAPTGYSWYPDRDAGVAVLKPDGWFVKTETKNGTDSLFISKEDIATSGEFQTGLSLNLVHGVKKKSGLSSTRYAVAFLSKALEGNEELMSFANQSNGMNNFGIRIKNQNLNIVIHYYLVANDAEDTLRIFMFESPIKDWDAAWQIGEPMFRNLILVLPKDS